MSRIFPLGVLLVMTLLGAGLGFGATTVLGMAVGLTPEEQVPAPDAAGAPALNAKAGATKPPPPRIAKTTDRQYLKGILCRNLFDPALVGQCDFDIDAKTKPGEAITDLNVTLLGTLVAEPASYSSALIIEQGEERAIGYSLHDKIRDAEIVAIESKLVRLKRADGREEVLTMDDEAPPPKPGAAPAAAAEEGGDDEVRKVGENHFEIDAATVDKYLSDLEGISRMGRALLHRGPDGEYDGFRLTAIRRNTIADKLGIRNGDVVHGVNGTTLDSLGAAMSAFETLQNEKQFSFEVTRRGKRQTMTYDVK